MYVTLIYKSNVVDLEKMRHENEREFEMRKWFVLKNISSIISNSKHEIVTIGYSDLINYSKIYIQKELYGCGYPEYIMKNCELLEKNLFCL